LTSPMFSFVHTNTRDRKSGIVIHEHCICVSLAQSGIVVVPSLSFCMCIVLKWLWHQCVVTRNK